MASHIPSNKVKDNEYKNWLKVTLALYYMKSGLHTFIENEIDSLHQSLIHKIYGGPTVPLPPCTMCHASHVKRHKFTGGWAFQNQCKSYCDVWLHELLVLHTNPLSDKIYWNNSDIPSWPFKPWECAKVFMPRGQNSSNCGPSECDAQALLTLLASCTHFHPKLSQQGLDLTRKISKIRDKVMHSSEMKLSDADRISFVQQITELLKDPVKLNAVAECNDAVDNINEIVNDSLDVYFNVDIELMTLKASLTELRLEVGTHTQISDTVYSLEEKIKQLTERLEDVDNQTAADLQEMKTRLEAVSKWQENKKPVIQSAIQAIAIILPLLSIVVTCLPHKYLWRRIISYIDS